MPTEDLPTEDLVKAATASEPLPDLPFYVPATTSATRPRRTLKHGDSFLLLDSHGDMGASQGGPDGLFHLDTRYLSHFELLINGMQPLLLGSHLSKDNAVLNVDLTNPDIFYRNKILLEKNLLHIARSVFVWRGCMWQRFALRNYGAHMVRLLLSLSFDSDFADVFEVRGATRERRGSLDSQVGNDRDILTYRGLDDIVRRATIAFDSQPRYLSRSLASFYVDLEPNNAIAIQASVACDNAASEPAAFSGGLAQACDERKNLIDGETRIVTSNPVFNEVLRRSAADLAMLLTDTPQGPYPYAGIPWYSTTFGRDGLITGLQCLWLDARIPRAVLKRLAALQADAFDPDSDAEPGKIIHEMRSGEMANLREVPFGRYYGSIDSTPLFVLLAGAYARTTGDIETLKELWPAIDRALGWIDGPGDPDGDGFVEYFRATPQGLANQGWKDSYDSVFHADGRLAQGPIALAEVQGYVFGAKRMASWCAKELGFVERGEQLARQAESLAGRFDAAFWCEDLSTYALALDGEKQPCRVSTSNGAQVLVSGIARSDRAARIAEGLLQPRFFSGWGIRTLAEDQPRYNPMSYHNGSIWPHDNALIALGLARYGAKRPVARIFEGLFEAATYLDLSRLPELFCGFSRLPGQGPTLYPVACAPQAWAAGTFYALLQAALGLELSSPAREIRFYDPLLPDCLDEVILSGLRTRNGSADVAIRRKDGHTVVETLHTHGDVAVRTVALEN